MWYVNLGNLSRQVLYRILFDLVTDTKRRLEL